VRRESIGPRVRENERSPDGRFKQQSGSESICRAKFAPGCEVIQQVGEAKGS